MITVDRVANDLIERAGSEAPASSPAPGLRSRLTSRGACIWHIGGGTGLLWQGILVVTVILEPTPPQQKAFGLGIMAVLYLAFLLLGPLIAPESVRVKVLAVLGFWAASATLFPLIGPDAEWVWMLVVALAAYSAIPLRFTLPITGAVILAQLAIGLSTGFSGGGSFAPLITSVVAATMIAGGILTRSNRNLHLANDEIARLAVVDERARFSRDLHDILGHSLTVVTVKSELAKRLVAIDPQKAVTEIADIERLARTALADLRLAVTNYREADLESELASARIALDAAEINATLPECVDAVDPRLNTVFAWVLREGVTNVIRHSGADACWVTVDRDHLSVHDNGLGPSGPRDTIETIAGNGLRGLRERAAAAGVALRVQESRYGGFALTVRRNGV